MGCLLGCVALLFPRLVLFILWLATLYLHRAYDTWLWPLLGFFFMPFTTLAYAVARNEGGGQVQLWGVLLLVLGVLLDLGLVGGGGHRTRLWYGRRRPRLEYREYRQ